MQNLHIATIIIIAANVIISMKGFNDFAFFEKYKFNIAGIRRGEHIRMFSSAFQHAYALFLCTGSYYERWGYLFCDNLCGEFADR